jgi:hypothetical protein
MAISLEIAPKRDEIIEGPDEVGAEGSDPPGPSNDLDDA